MKKTRYTRLAFIALLIIASHFYGIYIGELRGRMNIMISKVELTNAGQ